MLSLSKREARRLMIGSQLLSGPPPKRPSRARMLETIRQIGAVQIDSISVVQRSHHIVLWSRLGNHPPEWLNDLLANDQAIFEYWVHAAAYAPIELYPHFRRQMLNFHSRASAGTREWMDENAHILEQVVEYIRETGPVTTKSFDPPEDAERPAPWAWYGNKPTNVALEILWTDGTLMIDRRDKFQRVYDLQERVLPDWDDCQLPSEEETHRALALTTLNALGVSTLAWLPDYFRSAQTRPAIPRRNVHAVLESLVDEGHAVRAQIKGIDEPAYASTQALEKTFRISRTTLLSSFDNLVWHRRRAKELFDFDLLLEAYTPKPKRVYGYFSLPILYRDQLVGRLDPKAHRKTGELSVNAFHLEPWFIGKDDERFYLQLADALHDFSAFNETNHVVVRVCDPPEARQKLVNALVQRQREGAVS